jgi:hypothetical protein
MRPFEEPHAFVEHREHKEKKNTNQYHTESTEGTRRRQGYGGASREKNFISKNKKTLCDLCGL